MGMNNETSISGRPDDVDWDVLARYQAGECTPKEAEQVQRWLADHPRQALAFSGLGAAVERLGVRGASEVDVSAALRTVTERARENPSAVRPIQRPVRTPAWGVRRLAIAAGLVIAASGLVLRYIVVGARSVGSVGSTVVASRTYTTAVGVRDSVRLPDGTRVDLTPGSSLTVAAGYGETNRAVMLRGEAFFVAVHDSVHPFSVKVDGATVRDIGTAFAVRNEETGIVRVTVTAGVVVLRTESDTGVTLHVNEIGIVDGDAAHRVSVQRASLSAASWTPGQLVLDHAPLAEARDVIRRWYGVEMTFDSTLAGRHVTATFTDESVPQVVAVISRTIGAAAEWKNGSVALHEIVAPHRSK